jgi:hypothetical protein
MTNFMYPSGKPLKFGVKLFLNYKNRFTGSKVTTTKNKKIGGIFGKPHFLDQKPLNWSNLVKTYRNSLIFCEIFKIKQRTRI